MKLFADLRAVLLGQAGHKLPTKKRLAEMTEKNYTRILLGIAVVVYGLFVDSNVVSFFIGG